MPALLKDIYNAHFFGTFIISLEQVIPGLEKHLFLSQVYDEKWEQRALKERMKHIAAILHIYLKGNYKRQITALIRIIEQCRENGAKEQALEYMFFPEYISMFGINDFKTSMMAIEFVTGFASCEFAIRPFLNCYFEQTMAQMLEWSTHDSPNVRRFASEGSRPRLPWGLAVTALKTNPAPIIPVLENLKNDPSVYVRRSVANNLNDIAKDHPDLVMEIAGRWKGTSKETDWIIRHGSRTLLRKANKHSLSMWGLSDAPGCSVKNLVLQPNLLAIGNILEFSFDLFIEEEKALKLRIEYAVDYLKANAKHSRKLFRITEHFFESNQTYRFKRKQSFRDLTTRKHYPGPHQLSIVVNGLQMATCSFELTTNK